MTSFAVSRGRLESLVGNIFAAGGLSVHFEKISTVVLDISYHWAFITTHLTSQKVQQPAVMSGVTTNFERWEPAGLLT